MATETLARRSARDRLLDAADDLFYEEGVHTVAAALVWAAID